MLLFDHIAGGIDRHLIRHRLYAERFGEIDKRLFLRFAALFLFGIAHIHLRTSLVPGRRIDIDFERPDDIQLFLRPPEHLDLPRIRAGIADCPKIVLLLAGVVLIDVDFVILGIVRQAARDAREKLARIEVARLWLELVADFHVDLRLFRLHHLHDLVRQKRPLVRRFVKAGIDEKERAVASLECSKLRPIQFDVSVLAIHIGINPFGRGPAVFVVCGLVVEMDA